MDPRRRRLAVGSPGRMSVAVRSHSPSSTRGGGSQRPSCRAGASSARPARRRRPDGQRHAGDLPLQPRPHLVEPGSRPVARDQPCSSAERPPAAAGAQGSASWSVRIAEPLQPDQPTGLPAADARLGRPAAALPSSISAGRGKPRASPSSRCRQLVEPPRQGGCSRPPSAIADSSRSRAPAPPSRRRPWASARDIGSEIDQRRIGLMPHGGDQRDVAGRGRTHHDLLVEGPEVFQAAAAARHDQQIGPRQLARRAQSR